VSYGACKNEDTQKRQGDNEQVKVAVVPFSHAVSNPRTMVVEALCKNSTLVSKQSLKDEEHTNTVITETAMRGSWWAENLASETILKFDSLPLDLYFFGAWRRAIRWRIRIVRNFCN
jgi:hypothetical protein